MSDLMLLGILRMPPETWGDDPLNVMQRHSAYKEAADRLDRMMGCRICGGVVDLTNAIAPTVRVGVGRPSKSRMCPECHAMGGPDGVTNCATCRGGFWDGSTAQRSGDDHGR